MLRAVAANGGVVMINFFSAFIDEEYNQAIVAQTPAREAALAAVRAKHKKSPPAVALQAYVATERQWAEKLKRPPFKSLIDHIDHVAKVAGVDHVGLGSDFDGVTSLPEGIDSVADLPRITEALLERGYTPEQVHKILGGNFMRVFREAERVSRELRGTPEER
jgi:membrane dipeptidase